LRVVFTGFCFVLSFTFGWAILPLNYLASMLFKIPLIGFAFMLLFNIITGVTFFLTTFLLTVENNNTNGADIMSLFGTCFPNFLLIQGFYRINLIGGYKEVNKIVNNLQNCFSFISFVKIIADM